MKTLSSSAITIIPIINDSKKNTAKGAKYLNLILFHSVWTFRLSVELLSCEKLLKSDMLCLQFRQKTKYPIFTRTDQKNLAVIFATVSARINLHSLKLLGQDRSLFREGIHRIIYILECTSYHIKDECCNLFSMAWWGKLWQMKLAIGGSCHLRTCIRYSYVIIQ